MTGLIVAAAIIGLICVVGAVVLFLLLPLLLAGVAFLALLTTMIVVAVVLVPNFVTLDSFKPQISEAVQQALGREISIGGPIGFSVWPVLGLQLKDISLGNPAGSKEPIMLSAQELGVGVTLSSLLDHRLELRELRLVGPQINLSVDAQGRGNWVFASRHSSRRNDAANDQPKDNGGNVENKPLEIKDVEIKRVEVIDGNLSYDGANGSEVDLEDIDLVFTMPGLDEKAEASGDLTFRGREVKLTGSLDQPRNMTKESGAALEASLSFGADDLKLSGSVHQQDFKGQIKGTIADMSALVGWATDNPAAALPFKVMSLQTGLEVSLAKVLVSDMSLMLDDTAISGTASAQWAGAKPYLKADIDVGTLTLDRFLSPANEKPEGEKSAERAGPDLSGLMALNADLTARLAGVTFHGTEIGATTLRVDLQNGKVQSSISPASLYGGTVRGKLDLLPSARRSPPGFAAAVTLDGVNIDQLLTNLNGSSRLSGTADFTTTLTGPVLGGEALMAALDGEGRFMFRDGAVKGVNIAAILRRAKALLGSSAGAAGDGPAQTDFTEMSGSFRITDGVARNDDLKMLSPLLRVTGKGNANLASQTADYRIEAALVADLTGQGGVMQRRGLVVPVNVRGPFSNLSYEPDLAGLALGNVDAARQAGEAIRNLNPRDVREGAKGALQNLLGGGQPSQPAPTPAPTPAPEAKPADNPLDSLQNMLKR
jgi:AsmA protein